MNFVKKDLMVVVQQTKIIRDVAQGWRDQRKRVIRAWRLEFIQQAGTAGAIEDLFCGILDALLH